MNVEEVFWEVAKLGISVWVALAAATFFTVWTIEGLRRLLKSNAHRNKP